MGLSLTLNQRPSVIVESYQSKNNKIQDKESFL